MEEYQSFLPENGLIAIVNHYCDSHILSSTGTQKSNNMRLRFSSIRGRHNQWEEVGILPSVQTFRERKSDNAIKPEKLLLLHRLNYLVFKELIKATYVGIKISDKFLYPRICINVFDQP